MSELETLKRLLQGGAVGRRDFMTRAAALGTSGLIATSLAGRAMAAEMPKRGGHLRFAMGHGETSDTLDPAHVNNGFVTAVHYAITNMLTEVGAAGELLPKLAESWDASAGASKWTFKLRQGVTFHDGRPFTAEDVLASINYHRGEDSKSAAKPMVDPIVDIKADGKHTVVVELDAGDADFPFKLSDFNFPIYPAKSDGSLDWQSGNGCGGYRLKAFEPGVRADFERNADFWQGDQRAHFDSGELLSIIDVTARQNALITGEVDGIDRIDFKTADRLAAREGIVVEEVEGKIHYTFPMRTDTPPFNDNNVRLAVKHAIDREALLKSILFGHGTVGNDQPINGSYPFFAADIPQRDYDPDKAKHYLKQAGLSSLDVDLSAADAAFAGAVDAAVLVKEHAAKAGINVNVVREPSDGYWANVWMQRPWCASYWFGTPTPDGIFTQAFSAGAAWNDSYWASERFNELLLTARAELDGTKRAEMYHDMQLLVRDEGGVFIPLFANNVVALSDKVRHGPLANNLDVDGRLFFERWWFA